jgi:hypothetical protein
MTYYESFQKLVANFSKTLPGFNIKYKNESTLMKIISYILFFNKVFMTNMITTLGKTVYFPNEEDLKNTESYSKSVVLAHEFRHAMDASNFWKQMWMSITYLFPQILAPFMLILLPFCWWLSLILFAAFLAPIPSPSRMYWELRGYRTSIFAINEVHRKKWGDENLEVRKDILYRLAEKYDNNFTGSGYYFMWPFGVEDKLKETADKALADELVREDDFYLIVRQSMIDSWS